MRLTGRDAQIPYTPQAAATLRPMLAEASRAGAPPAIVGIGKAFHVPGAIPGESETQIFLLASDNRPVSLNVIRRPGEQPIWAVALSEIVDDAAAPPEPNTLLWYRLACTLPRALPRQSYAEAEAGQIAAIQSDYRYILQRLGPCPRSRARARRRGGPATNNSGSGRATGADARSLGGATDTRTIGRGYYWGLHEAESEQRS